MSRRKGDDPSDLSDAELESIQAINVVKALGEEFAHLLDTIDEAAFDADKRWLAIARTDLQKGIMSLERAIRNPEGF